MRVVILWLGLPTESIVIITRRHLRCYVYALLGRTNNKKGHSQLGFCGNSTEIVWIYSSRFFLLAFERLYFNLRSIPTKTRHQQDYNNSLKKSLEIALRQSVVCFPFCNLRHKDKQFQIYSVTSMIIHAFVSCLFPSGEGRGGMHPYQQAITEEKLLSSKKAMSFQQRYWKGVIPSESCCSAASGANCR